MKLHLVDPKTGTQWVRQGIRAFWKQPLGLSGLFFMFLATLSLCSLLPVVGTFLALVMLPAATLGLMAATREVDLGKFPMPATLIVALRAGQPIRRDMVILGILYALGFLGVVGVSALVDDGAFAKMYLMGGTLDAQTVTSPDFQNAMWLTLLLYLPLSLLFWHAPALVFWHGVPVGKSLFFSVVACLQNWRAFLMFGVMWALVFFGTTLAILLLSGLLGDGEFAGAVLLPAMLMLAAMFFASTYFSFRDCFTSDTLYA